MTKKFLEKLGGRWWLPALFLISLVFILDGRYFTSPPLRSDDWNLIVEPTVFNPLGLIRVFDRRPLQRSLLAVLTPLFRVEIQWYYVVNWLILFASAVVIYVIIKRVYSRYAWLAFPVAAIYLVYPASYARTWLNIFSNNFAFLVSLLSILWLIIYARTGKIRVLILANAACLYSLLAYEAGFGIMMMTAVLLILSSRKISAKRRVAIGTFFVTGIVYLVWRMAIQPNLLAFQDFYISNIEHSIPVLLQRYIQGAFIFLYNWVGPIFQGFGDQKYWIFVGVCLLGILTCLAFTPKILRSARANTLFGYEERVSEVKSLLGVSLMGVLFWAAGYIPVIFLWSPAFYGDASRVNFSSIPGASLALVAGVAVLITVMAPTKEWARRMALLAIVPLVLIGMVYQVHAQNFRFRVWDINKAFWQEMFLSVPNLKPGTKVVVVLPGYESLEPFEMLPFRGDWEAESALRVLYNEPDLFAEYYYQDLPGLPDNWAPTEAEFSRLALLFYDVDNNQLRLIEDPQTALGLSLDASAYDPAARMRDFEPDVARYRFLVE